MNHIKTVIVGVILAASSMTVDVQAQPSGSQQNSGYGYGMGPWMMGQGGMMGGYPMGPGMMGRYGNGAGWGGQGGAQMCGMMSYQMGGRLAYLKTELQITKTQEALWTAYADTVQSSSQSMVSRCSAMMGGNAWNKSSLPDRLALHEQFMAVQIDALRSVDKSLKPLYAALSDGQKKVADQLIWCPMGMM